MRKGLFITFEGPEGCGKSTHCKLLAKALKERNIPFVTVREPGGTKIGEAIRKVIKQDFGKNPMNKLTELFLFEAARAQLVGDIIEPAIKQGKIVLCDRFTDSTVVYQGYARGLDKKIIFELNKIATNNLEPDITFLLDLPVEEGLKRIHRRGKNDRIEKETITFHKKVRAGYLELSQIFKSRFKVINSFLPKNDVHKQILDITLNAIAKL